MNTDQRRFFRTVFFVVAFVHGLAYFVPARAQEASVATGACDQKSCGTYSTMFKQLTKVCGSEMVLSEVNTSGSVQNIDLLQNNKVNAAFVQTDILHYRKLLGDNMGSIKTLFQLYPEEVHVFTLAAGRKEGGVLGVGATLKVFNYVTDLAGRKVGAAGGSVVTARVVQQQGAINYQVVEYPSTDAARAALDKGDVDAVFAVGGAKLGSVEALDARYKLLSFPDNTIKALEGIYVPARVSYPNMVGQNGVARTVATRAQFVTRDYKTPRMVEGLTKLRACLAKNLGELQEGTGSHPKWQDVSAEPSTQWPWYQPPKGGR